MQSENQQPTADDGIYENQLDFKEIDNRLQNDPGDGCIDFKVLSSDEEDIFSITKINSIRKYTEI